MLQQVKVFELIGKNAISMKSGGELYARISPLLLNQESIELDFEGVELFASPFFNASIGLLLKDLKVEDLQRLMSIEHLNVVGKQLLNHVIANALKFYSNNIKLAEAVKGTDLDSGDIDE